MITTAILTQELVYITHTHIHKRRQTAVCTNLGFIKGISQCSTLFIIPHQLTLLQLHPTLLQLQHLDIYNMSRTQFRLMCKIGGKNESIWIHEEHTLTHILTLYALSVTFPRVRLLWTSTFFSMRSPLLGCPQNRRN